jgi:hypothetical protein
MKKTLLLLPFLFFTLTGMAQQHNMPPQAAGMFNPLVITNGKANIDGKNSQSCIYSYSGPDSAWTAAFSNTTDKEALVIMYTKTTASNLVVTFPTGSVIKQPTAMPGISLAGNVFYTQLGNKRSFPVCNTGQWFKLYRADNTNVHELEISP